MAAPIIETNVTAPRAIPRDSGGNQRVMTRAVLGYAPASPAPKRNRINSRDPKPNAAPDSAVKSDHHVAIRVITPRLPNRSPQCPVGTSNRQYASVKALKTRLICVLE